MSYGERIRHRAAVTNTVGIGHAHLDNQYAGIAGISQLLLDQHSCQDNVDVYRLADASRRYCVVTIHSLTDYRPTSN